MGKNLALTKRNFLEALPKSDGMIKEIAERCGVCRPAVYNFLKKYPDMKALLDDATNVVIDEAESVMHTLIREKNFKACKFYLQTKGKHRGYTKTITIRDGENESDDPLREHLDKVKRKKARIKKKKEEADNK